MLVSFVPLGRAGNLLFEYLACKVIQIRFGHSYVPYDEFPSDGAYIIEEEDYFKVTEELVKEKNVLFKGYFQKSDILVPYRNELLKLLQQSLDETWSRAENHYCIRDFVCNKGFKIPLNQNDVVLSFRLDDFIQLPRESSDILPPQFYFRALDTFDLTKGNVYIICDNIHYEWEQEYFKCFEKYHPIIGIPGIKPGFYEDFGVMRDCPNLIHSNSTFCWIASFLSELEDKKRVIPKTNFYKGQTLLNISNTDYLWQLKPLLHHEVFGLKAVNYPKYPVYSFSYSIPDEYVVSEVNEKIYEISTIKPRVGFTPYEFTKDTENEYFKSYQLGKFGLTRRKGGWDCLRHYEILASGCIPLYENLSSCPERTLTDFPKDLLLEIYQKQEDIKKSDELYKIYSDRLLRFTKQHCTSSARAKKFLDLMRLTKPNPKILLLTCDIGVNYLRDMFWIGMKRMFPESTTEYPTLEYLYDDFPKERCESLPGNGFSYSLKLPIDLKQKRPEQEIRDSIRRKEWDVIIYGKMGPDEGPLGSIPNVPFWRDTFESKIPVAFFYGGDEPFCLRTFQNIPENRKKYIIHLLHHSKFGTCFVRELE